jgi:hypothetical protein
VDSPGCSTNPPTPGRILHDANLDEAEPCRSEAVSPSAKPSTLPFAAGFRCQSPTVRRDLVLIFPSTRPRATWSRRNLPHPTELRMLKTNDTRACLFYIPKRSKRTPSVQSCSSNKRFDHLDSSRRPNCRGNRHENIVWFSTPCLYLRMTRFFWAYWRAAFARFASKMVGVTNWRGKDDVSHARSGRNSDDA